MPALIAYLVALAVLLGGGYGGLYVLTHPSSEPKLAQASSIKSPAKKNAASRVATKTEPPDAAAESEAIARAPIDAPSSAQESGATPSDPPMTASTPTTVATTTSEVASTAPETTSPTSPTSTSSDAMAAVPPPDRALPAQGMKLDSSKLAPSKSAERKSRKTRLAQRHDKPVMMTLRTIEYTDGRIEQRLIPLSSPRRSYGRADWDDDPFD